MEHCRCQFCTHPVDISQSLDGAIPLCCFSRIDNTWQTVLWYGGKDSNVNTHIGEFKDLQSCFLRLMIEPDKVYVSDTAYGCVQLISIKKTFNWSKIKSKTDTSNIGKCKGEWKSVDINLLMSLFPETSNTFRLPTKQKRTMAAQEADEFSFNPHMERSCFWTSEKVRNFIRRDNQSSTTHLNPVLLRIIDEERPTDGAPQYKCVFQHSDGTEAEAWIAFGDLCSNKTYYTIWSNYEKNKVIDDTSWDSFDASAD